MFQTKDQHKTPEKRTKCNEDKQCLPDKELKT